MSYSKPYLYCNKWKYTGAKSQDGYRNLELKSQSIRNCIEVINRNGGFGIQTAPGSGPNFGKQLPLWGGPNREYYECIRQNEKLNEQRILQLTQKLLMLTNR